mgnify:FL=1
MSGKRDEYTIASLRRAQFSRQAILDYLHANQWASFEAVLTALQRHPELNVNAVSLRGAVANMLKKREIAASGHPRQRSYMALIEFTESAEAQRAAQLMRQKINNAKRYDEHAERTQAARLRKKQETDEAKAAKSPKVNEWNGGSIKHIGGSLPPGADQRGQGAVRQPVTVNCFITW